MSIDQIPGVGEKTAEKLRDAGYHDLMALATAPVSFLVDECGLGEATARKIIQEARGKLNMGFGTAMDLLKKREAVGYITTCSKALDDLLGGKGVETQSITEAAASFGSGKTQLGLQLAVNVTMPKERGGLDGIAVYIDNENTFRPERIVQIAKALKIDAKSALENIKVARAYSSDHQMLLVEKIPDLIEKEKLNVKLIIIDSLTGLFRAEYMGRGHLADRQQKLNKHLHDLQRMADRYNLAIFVTNQVMSRPDVFFGNPEAAIGGNIVAHASTFRMIFRKSRGDKRVAKLIDSPNLPDGEAVFRVCEEGIRD
ncbi:MAG: DNA repair and recombination protein RadA [Candidatus Nanoarchaeia archaeon]|nr:DNA repair and recombination protein RadA [Candidatus Nanoarchaeia archaeon]